MSANDTLVRPSLAQSMMPSAEEIRSGRRSLHRNSVFIAALTLGSYLALVFAPVNVWLHVLFAAVLAVACVSIATNVMHDGNHGAYSVNHRRSRLAGWSSDLLGASSFLWRFKHNRLHHGNTNVTGFDADIDQMPFARLAPQQPWKPWYRFQHLYMWPLYGFLTLQWFVASDYQTLMSKRVGPHALPTAPRRRDVALIVFGKVLHASWALVLPMFFHPWWQVLVFYLAISWVVGFLLANIFQLAHCVDQAEFFTPDADRRGSAFELHQLRTTVDIRCKVRVMRPFVRWLMGGLDYQIEHHLAPKLPSNTLHLAAPRLEAACLEQGVEYHVHTSISSAIRSHGRWLREMGRRPTV
jgi:linoleoyl-CoA desaturase